MKAIEHHARSLEAGISFISDTLSPDQAWVQVVDVGQFSLKEIPVEPTSSDPNTINCRIKIGPPLGKDMANVLTKIRVTNTLKEKPNKILWLLYDAPGGALIALPTSSPMVFSKAISFFGAQRRRTRLLQYGLRILARLGLQAAVARGYILVDEYAPSAAAAKWSFVVRTGYFEPTAKTLVFKMVNAGQLQAIAKIEAGENSEPWLQREARALQRLEGNRCIPSLIEEGRCAEYQFFVQSALSIRRPFSIHDGLSPRVIAFLSDLRCFGTTPKENAQTHWLDNISHQLGALEGRTHLFAPARKALGRLSEKADKINIRFGPAHGDFTPWNLGWTGEDELAVVDWEMFMETAPEGYDLCYFVFQTELLIKKRSVRNIRTSMERAIIEHGSTTTGYSEPADAIELITLSFALQRLMIYLARAAYVGGEKVIEGPAVRASLELMEEMMR